MGGPLSHALLAVVLATLLTVGTSSMTGSGLCSVGSCINCFYCDGDCFSRCQCFSGLNTCCCRAPPGHFSRGYGKLACPAGTFQDDMGGAVCKECRDGTEKYDMRVRGAIDNVDCDLSKCSYTCGNDQTCVENHCRYQESHGGKEDYTAAKVIEMMTARPARTDFCTQVGIPASGCSWNEVANSARGGQNDIRLLFGPVLVLVMLLRTLHEGME